MSFMLMHSCTFHAEGEANAVARHVRRYFDVESRQECKYYRLYIRRLYTLSKGKGGETERERERDKESGFARSRVGTGVRGTDFPGAPT